jgi:hypothetical protein
MLSPRHEPVWRVVPLNARTSVAPPDLGPPLPPPTFHGVTRRDVVTRYAHGVTSPVRRGGRSLSGGRTQADAEAAVEEALRWPQKTAAARHLTGRRPPTSPPRPLNPTVPLHPADSGDAELYSAVMATVRKGKEGRARARAAAASEAAAASAAAAPAALPPAYRRQLAAVDAAVAQLASEGARPWNIAAAPSRGGGVGGRVFAGPTRTSASAAPPLRRRDVEVPPAAVGGRADVRGYVLPEFPAKFVTAIAETPTQTAWEDATALLRVAGLGGRGRGVGKGDAENRPPFDLHTCAAPTCKHTEAERAAAHRTLVGLRRTGGGFTGVVRPGGVGGGGGKATEAAGAAAASAPFPASCPCCVAHAAARDAAAQPVGVEEQRAVAPAQAPAPAPAPLPPPVEAEVAAAAVAQAHAAAASGGAVLTVDQLMTFMAVFSAELSHQMSAATTAAVADALGAAAAESEAADRARAEEMAVLRELAAEPPSREARDSSFLSRASAPAASVAAGGKGELSEHEHAGVRDEVTAALRELLRRELKLQREVEGQEAAAAAAEAAAAEAAAAALAARPPRAPVPRAPASEYTATVNAVVRLTPARAHADDSGFTVDVLSSEAAVEPNGGTASGDEGEGGDRRGRGTHHRHPLPPRVARAPWSSAPGPPAAARHPRTRTCSPTPSVEVMPMLRVRRAEVEMMTAADGKKAPHAHAHALPHVVYAPAVRPSGPSEGGARRRCAGGSPSREPSPPPAPAAPAPAPAPLLRDPYVDLVAAIQADMFALEEDVGRAASLVKSLSRRGSYDGVGGAEGGAEEDVSRRRHGHGDRGERRGVRTHHHAPSRPGDDGGAAKPLTRAPAHRPRAASPAEVAKAADAGGRSSVVGAPSHTLHPALAAAAGRDSVLGRLLRADDGRGDDERAYRGRTRAAAAAAAVPAAAPRTTTAPAPGDGGPTYVHLAQVLMAEANEAAASVISAASSAAGSQGGRGRGRRG